MAFFLLCSLARKQPHLDKIGSIAQLVFEKVLEIAGATRDWDTQVGN
jgi:hypothetical protein